MVLSEWGFWGEELIGPMETFDKAGYETVFATPTGKRPVAISVSKDAGYVDPPLGRSVTSAEMAEKVKAIDDPKNPRLDKPIDLSAWFPMRPYWSAPEVLRKWEAYYRDVAKAQEQVQQYDALVIAGGSGPIVDLANNHRVHDLIFGFLRYDKPVAAECYAVTCPRLPAISMTVKASSGGSMSPATAKSTTTWTGPASCRHATSSWTLIWGRRPIPWNTSCGTPPDRKGATTAMWAGKPR